MDYTFANGNSIQKSRWKEAVERLLHMPSDALPLAIAVSFVDPSELANSHTTLADTTWTYDSTDSTTEVRNNAPGFGDLRESLEAEAAALGLTFSAEKFYTETAIHELGHSFFAALPEVKRIKVAQMFGAKSDSLSELAPSGATWQNKIIEGIAETFKEAFLPRRYRVFPNRTNKKIPYDKFAEFRSYFRIGIGEVGSGDGEPVPAYDEDVWRQNKLEANTDLYTPGEQAFKFMFKDLAGGGLYDYSVLDWGPIEADDNTLYRRYEAHSGTEVLLVPRGTNFRGTIQMPQDASYLAPSTDFAPIHGSHYGEAGFFGTFTSKQLSENPEFDGPFGPFTDPNAPERFLGAIEYMMAFCYWKPSTGHWVAWDLKYGGVTGYAPLFFAPHPNFPTNCWIIVKPGQSFVAFEGESLPLPIGTVSLNSDVPSDAPTIETCGGDMVKVRIFGEVTFKSSVSTQDSIDTIQSRLPSFTITRAARPCGGGVPIVLPSASLTPYGSRSGAHPCLHPVAG